MTYGHRHTHEEGPLDQLIRALAGLPGLGPRSARRIALHLLSKRDTTMAQLTHALDIAASQIKACATCGNLDVTDPCRVCQSAERNNGQICVVSTVSDLWAIERTSAFKGRYHILGGLLSALDGIRPEHLTIDSLVNRVQGGDINEIIMALSATVDGQTTSHYIADKLHGTSVKISRLAHGIPVGGDLDYLDDGTIATALKSRA